MSGEPFFLFSSPRRSAVADGETVLLRELGCICSTWNRGGVSARSLRKPGTIYTVVWQKGGEESGGTSRKRYGDRYMRVGNMGMKGG